MRKSESFELKTIVREFVIWESPGDELPYWVSDEYGVELIAFKTYKECEIYIDNC